MPLPIPLDISGRYATITENIVYDDTRWTMLAVEDTNALVDAITPEEFARHERLPYWAELWTSSIALAGALRRRTDLADTTVLDLGCGLGLTGIAAAQAGASVVMTDYDEDALRFARWNLAANLTCDELRRVTVRKFDWREAELIGEFPLIVGADIVYERTLFPALLALFHRHLAPGGCVLLADPGRSIGTDFLRNASDGGFFVDSHRVSIQRKGMITQVVLSTLNTSPTPAQS